jgi:hypothetical protein
VQLGPAVAKAGDGFAQGISGGGIGDGDAGALAAEPAGYADAAAESAQADDGNALTG